MRLDLRKPDRELALEALRRLIGEPTIAGRLVVVVSEGTPVPKARPRFFRGHAVTDKATVLAEADLAWRYKQAMAGQPFTCTLALAAIFVRPNALRCDVDNLAKLALDAGNRAGAWRDDSDILAKAAYVELDRQRPRTVIAMCPYVSSMLRDPVKPKPQPFKLRSTTPLLSV